MYILVSYFIIILVTWLSWIRFYGPVRATMSALLRAGWLLPILLLFFPQPTVESVSGKITKSNIHLFLDDSESVITTSANKKVSQLIEHLVSKCKSQGCNLKITKMSDVYEDTSEGYSSIFDAVSVWLSKTNGEPWIVVTDGADSIPKRRWPEEISGIALNKDQTQGLSIFTGNSLSLNYSVESRQDTLFGFRGKPLQVPIRITRSVTNTQVTAQVQLSSKNIHLGSQNVTFNEGDSTIEVDIAVDSLSKGNHLIKIVLLPVDGETAVWDNTIYLPVEIMSNTIGVLHILGAPSWDGRYLRRYFKSEPKYDMISFFILRDPTDSQFVKERDLSLIPFPVDRLFTQELENFSAVVIQNFTLYQFLQREYQENLVKFVKNGGGLLFLGGKRSLTDLDMKSSPLAEILPFEVKTKSAVPINPYSGMFRKRSGSTYDSDIRFKIEMADPSPEQRAIAGVYDDLVPVVSSIGEKAEFQGLNIIKNIKIDEKRATPILNARSGTVVHPLALASYPGKGRALWFMSDMLHSVALTPQDDSSSSVYNDFLSSSMKWLLKKEFQKPISIDYTDITPKNKDSVIKLGLRGSATRYLQEKKRWQLVVCGIRVDYKDVEVFNSSENNATLKVTIPTVLSPGRVCEVTLSGEHPSFGQVKTNSSSLVRLKIKDVNMFSQLAVMKSLADDTGAMFLSLDDRIYSKLNLYIDRWSSKSNNDSKVREKLSENYYWFLSRSWIYLLLLCLPFEVLLRRWSVLFPSEVKN